MLLVRPSSEYWATRPAGIADGSPRCCQCALGQRDKQQVTLVVALARHVEQWLPTHLLDPVEEPPDGAFDCDPVFGLMGGDRSRDVAGALDHGRSLFRGMLPSGRCANPR